jgi:hypothetical protein
LAIQHDRALNKAANPATVGSKPLFKVSHEKYARNRAMLMPRYKAYRDAFGTEKTASASAGAYALERRHKAVADRIAYLMRQDTDQLRAKRQRLEENLWQLHEADIGDLFEYTEIPRKNRNGEPILDKSGNPVMRKAWRVRDLDSLPPELRQAIETITLDSDGNLTTAKLVSKIQANQELRKLLGLDRQQQAPQSDLSRLTDAELVAELSRQANELGVHIDLSYKFGEDLIRPGSKRYNGR